MKQIKLLLMQARHLKISLIFSMAGKPANGLIALELLYQKQMLMLLKYREL